MVCGPSGEKMNERFARENTYGNVVIFYTNKFMDLLKVFP